MEVSAKLSNLRMAPRKVRLVVDMIRGKRVEAAENILRFVTKKGASPVLKLLDQAVANAKNNFQVDKLNLFIQKITVDEGPKYKRWRPRSRGQAYEIQKKTSHITMVLEVLKSASKTEKKTAEKTVGAENIQKDKIFAKTKQEKPKIKVDAEINKPTFNKSIKRIFRRKAI